MTNAGNYDKSQDRKLRSLIKLGVVDYAEVMDRINQNPQYRITLAQYLLNVDCYYNPAQYLLSTYCQAALEKCRALNEVPPAPPRDVVDLPFYPDL
jgi:hypothetical protein